MGVLAGGTTADSRIIAQSLEASGVLYRAGIASDYRRRAMMENIHQFREVIQSIGLLPPDSIEPGKLHRFAGAGKRNGNTAAWCKLFPDGLGGVYGDHSQDISAHWQAERSAPFTQAQREAFFRKVQESKEQVEAEKQEKQSEAATKAAAIWQAAQPATGDHPYLKRKGIKANGARLYRGPLVIGGMACDGALVIPLREGAVIHSLQFIAADGRKRFLPDGRKKGCYFSIGTPKDAEGLCVVEGFATGATIHEATGLPVAVAFDAGNLEVAAVALRARLPDLALILCADDDTGTEGNPGMTKATAAALAIGARLAIPDFGEHRPEGATDFNDLAAHCGKEAVQCAIAGAIDVPARALPQPTENKVSKRDAEPLPDLPGVLPFDFEYLPNAVRGLVRDISERMQCPPDFAAVSAFVMIAAVVGRKVSLRPMRQNDWAVIPNLWAAAVGNSGVMKSPTISAVLSPIKRLQADAFDAFNEAKAKHEAHAELAKLQRSVKKTEARKELKAKSTANALEILKPDHCDEIPSLRRYITNNASYEALGELLIENPNGLLVEADEIIGLLKSLDAEGQQVARSFYLTAADGDKPYTFDRIMRGKGLHIPALCISIIGGIQPGVLAEYVRQATGGGAGADGLLQRFGLMVYPDISPMWKEVDRFPDAVARQALTELIDRLDALNPADVGAESDMYGGLPFLRFDNQAQSVFSEWRKTLEDRLRSGEEHPAIISHLSKYRKLIPSLALINHLCDSTNGPVTEQALIRAIAFGEYLESHARRIYSYATRPDIDAAKTILKRLKLAKLASPFKVRDIYRAGWTGLETPAKAQAATDLLLEYGHLYDERHETGGRSTTLYHWSGASQ